MFTASQTFFLWIIDFKLFGCFLNISMMAFNRTILLGTIAPYFCVCFMSMFV